ncbi:Jerky [Chionoecetes opilio]|uniref:Jerky n=1 Tax=Chionoecetes opilio TaxID=41210 RepID=A0A8J4Y515_CHIOP|nr:Jerky [Chionoecetes opilio]
MPKVTEKRRRKVLTLKQKLEICQRLEKNESRHSLMEEFGCSSSTIYDIKGQTAKLKTFTKTEDAKGMAKRQTLRKPKLEELDRALFEWFKLKRSEGACISGPLVMEKAKDFHEKLGVEEKCVFSSGWLQRFKARHGIRKLDLSR